MEAREGGGGGGGGGGVTVLLSDAPSDYQIVSRSEISNSTPGSAPAAAPPPSTAVVAAAKMPVKKKRGRPRNYPSDGSVAMALSPRPISSVAPVLAPPPVIDFTAERRPEKVKPVRNKTKHEMESVGDWVACSVGANFTPHIITVNAGEDVTMKVISFSQQGPRAICILSANGMISSVTLRQPDSSGGTLTYEGRFEILSLSGSFMPADTGGTRSRTGGLSVSLASPDGRVVGGGVAGLLVAASPVQVVVGSFLAGNQREPKQKKQRHDHITLTNPTGAVPISHADPKNFTSPSYHADRWSSLPVDTRNKPADINVSLPAE